MDKSQPEFVILKRLHVCVLRVIGNFVNGSGNTEHDGWMGKAAVEEHRVLDQTVEGRVANNLAGGGRACLVSEEHDVRATNVHISVPLHEVDLSFYSLRYTNVVRVHPGNVVYMHVDSNCYARIKCLRQASVLGQREQTDFVRIVLLCILQELHRPVVRRAIIDQDQHDKAFVCLVQYYAFYGFFEVVRVRVVDGHDDCNLRLRCVCLSEAGLALTCDEVADVHSREYLLTVVGQIDLMSGLKQTIHVL